MALKVRCPNSKCGAALALEDEHFGQKVKCNKCGKRFTARRSNETKASSEAARSTVAKSKTTNAAPSVNMQAEGELENVKHFGKFEIRRRIGAGAFGAVYEGYDPELDREVALKVPQAATLQSKKATGRFLREARAAAGLRHRNIVPVYEAGREGDQLYIASAFVEGQDLQQWINADDCDFRAAAKIVRRLAEGLQYAHKKGIVHRDVKPSNVMMDEDDEPQLMDFGLARFERSEEKLTQDGAVLGTPAYMSPEQARGTTDDIGPASDQYSLGVVLYELLCGETPFHGPPAVVVFNVINKEPPKLGSINPKIPADLETICQKAMSKQPDDRYADCRELAADLKRWMKGEPISARPVGMAERGLRWYRRNKLIALSAAAASLALIAVTWAVARSGGSGDLENLANANGGQPDQKTGQSPTPNPQPTPVVKTDGGKSKSVSPQPIPQPKPPKPVIAKSAAWDEVPPWAATSAVWQPPAATAAAERRTSRAAVLQGLTEKSVANLMSEWYTAGSMMGGPGMGPGGFPGGPGPFPGAVAPGVGQPQTRKPPATPPRFILTGKLGAVRSAQGKTWAYLWAEAKQKSAMFGAPPPYVGVEFNRADLAELMSDYRVGEPVRVVVALKNWVNPPAPQGAVQLTSVRPFKDLQGKTTGYWCFQGDAVEKQSSPEATWIDVKSGRAGALADAASVRNSLGVVFRSASMRSGSRGRVAGKLLSIRRENGKLLAVAALTSRLEGPLFVVGDLGTEARRNEFLDYLPGMDVELDLTLTSAAAPASIVDDIKGDEASGFLLPLAMRTRMMLPPFFVGTMSDPLTASAVMTGECHRIQQKDLPDTRVSATGPRRTSMAGELIPPDAIAADPAKRVGEPFTWTGKLQQIQRRSGETHVLVGVEGSLFGLQHVEGFSKDAALLAGLADYVDVQLSAKSPDTVTISGKLAAGTVANVRLDDNAPLFQIERIERKGEPQSRVVVGEVRDAATFAPNRTAGGLGLLLRDDIRKGQTVSFNAEFSSFSTSQNTVTVRFKDNSARRSSIAFPKATKADFQDYQRNDRVAVTGVVVEPWSERNRSDMKLTGTRIVREVNPRSEVTDAGRTIPALDFTLAKKEWQSIRNDRKAGGKSVQGGAIFDGYADAGGSCKISLKKLFFSYSSEDVFVRSNAQVREFLDARKPGDELLFEIALIVTRDGSKIYTLKWMALIGTPNEKITTSAPRTR